MMDARVMYGGAAHLVGLRPSRLFAFALMLTEPGGYWSRACDGDIVRWPVAGEGYRGEAV